MPQWSSCDLHCLGSCLRVCISVCARVRVLCMHVALHGWCLASLGCGRRNRPPPCTAAPVAASVFLDLLLLLRLLRVRAGFLLLAADWKGTDVNLLVTVIVSVSIRLERDGRQPARDGHGRRRVLRFRPPQDAPRERLCRGAGDTHARTHARTRARAHTHTHRRWRPWYARGLFQLQRADRLTAARACLPKCPLEPHIAAQPVDQIRARSHDSEGCRRNCKCASTSPPPARHHHPPAFGILSQLG